MLKLNNVIFLLDNLKGIDITDIAKNCVKNDAFKSLLSDFFC